MAKICLTSSSGGHFEELKMLKVLEKHHEVFFVTEKTEYGSKADYYLIQTGSTDKRVLPKMLKNIKQSYKIWKNEKPDFVITTGTLVALPMAFFAKIFRKKVIYIETFARIYDGTKSGKLMYRFADLFIYQWETLEDVYPKGIYGGSIF